MTTLLSRAAVLAAGLVLPLATAAQADGGRYTMWGGGWGWGHMIFGSVMMLALWGGIIVLVVLAVRWLGGPEHGHAPAGRPAIDILRERFARGEIEKAEFEERRRALGD